MRSCVMHNFLTRSKNFLGLKCLTPTIRMNFLFPLFNIFLGTVFLLIGLKIYKPFKKEKEEAMMKKFKEFYILGGLGLTAWGIVKLFQVI
jgi:hypothetical protein